MDKIKYQRQIIRYKQIGERLLNKILEQEIITKLRKYNQHEIVDLLNTFTDKEKEEIYNQVKNTVVI